LVTKFEEIIGWGVQWKLFQKEVWVRFLDKKLSLVPFSFFFFKFCYRNIIWGVIKSKITQTSKLSFFAIFNVSFIIIGFYSLKFHEKNLS
jgi:hypothetical protein